jgi:hypothetical protein
MMFRTIEIGSGGSLAPGRLLLCSFFFAFLSAGCTEPKQIPSAPTGVNQGNAIAPAPEPKLDAGDPSAPPSDAGAHADACSPTCGIRLCGDDGCGGRCGACSGTDLCQESTGRCLPCTGEGCECKPNCDRRVCGSDGCDGTCGDCEAGEICTDKGRCKSPACGNGMVEGDEECDGDEFCRPDCIRLTQAQSACMFGPTGANPACLLCVCVECTDEANECYISGSGPRDEACKTIAECAIGHMCSGLQDCVCGSQQCRPPTGPCLQDAQRALGAADIGLFEIQACFDDPECALYRANALGECTNMRCAKECKLTAEAMAPTPSMP